MLKEGSMRRKSASLFLVLLAVGCLAPTAALGGSPPPKRLWAAEDVFRLKGISDLQITPDGRHLYFVLSEKSLEEDGGSSRLFMMPTDGGAPRSITVSHTSISSPRVSPDGEKLAFFSYQDGNLGLWVVNSDGSGERKLTSLEKSNAYLGMRSNELAWSPDGQTLAYNAAGPRHYPFDPTPLTPPTGNDVMVVDRLLYKTFYYYSDLRRTYVWLISAQGGEPRRISHGDYDFHSISYSPDGKWVACVSNQTGKDDYNANNDVVLLSTEGKEMVQLTHTIGPEYGPVWSPGGGEPAYLGRTRDHRSKESDAELCKIYVIPRRGGTPTDLTAPLDRWSTSPIWSHDGGNVYFTAQNHGRVGIYSAPPYGGEVDRVFEEDAQVQDFCLGPNGEIYLVSTDFTHPPEIYRLRESATSKEQLTHFHEDFIEEVEIVGSEPFSYPSFDGVTIEGYLMKPAHFEEGRKYPLIHAIHGGPHGQYGYSLPRTTLLQYFAANGYAVMFINYRGSTGRGQEFLDLIVGDLCGGEYRDLMVGLDYVLENYPFLDPDRLGVTGGSYGGYLTNWIITQTDRYKAAVPVASISHMLTDWGTDANPLWFESDGGFMPIDDFEKAWDMSPIKHVKNCKTPTLFVHGAWDFCVNLNQAELMYTALKKLGVETVLAIYPNEGHGVHRYPKQVRDYYQRTLGWFDQHLK
jgi:dipeptidyl aminopeptidase/acylaminoacyl peptidase